MKIVREHINEKFTEENTDPIQDLGIGTIYLIKTWLKEHNIINYTINEDGTIDVNEEVHFSKNYNGLLSGNFPEYIQFGKIINGYFSIANNQLTSLKGCPRSVDRGNKNYNGDFNCESNNLTSLRYAPKYITGSFICYDNKKEFSKEDVEKVCKVGGAIRNKRNKKDI